jgi:hypothetical protein
MWKQVLPSHIVELPDTTPRTPSPETLDEMTMVDQWKIRDSPLWNEMVREFGEEEAERLLREFRVEVR